MIAELLNSIPSVRSPKRSMSILVLVTVRHGSLSLEARRVWDPG